MKLVKTLAIMLTLAPALPIAGQEPLTFEQLACMNWQQLGELYRRLEPGAAPNGFARGKAIYCPSHPLAHVRSKMTDRVWMGKHFCAADGTLVNQWKHVQAIRANVFLGPSWIDGKPAWVLDYRGVSHVWNDVRDEMRQVSPGIYIGAMFRDRCPGPRQQVFFVLEMTCR